MRPVCKAITPKLQNKTLMQWSCLFTNNKYFIGKNADKYKFLFHFLELLLNAKPAKKK